MTDYVIGADEVGRGCLAGPLVVCAVLVPAKLAPIKGVTDSKKLTPKRREELAATLTGHPDVKWALAAVQAEDIDKQGITASLKYAFGRAVQSMLKHEPKAEVLIDGSPMSGLPFDAQFIIKGDASNWVIGAASIIAKVRRDQYMADRAKAFPQYLWGKNAGYGTAEHIAAIRAHGLCPMHRATFCTAFTAPVATAEPEAVDITDLFG